MPQKTKYAKFETATAIAPGFSGAFIAEPSPKADRVVAFPRSQASDIFDKVILTCPSNVAAKMLPQLTKIEKQDLENIRYQGIVCASVLMKCSLSKYYVTNITDDAPFTGVIEMSALVDKKEFDRNALVYLPKYVAPDDELFEKTDQEIERLFLSGLEKMYPHFRRKDVLAFKVSRVRQVFPLPALNYSRDLSPAKTRSTAFMSSTRRTSSTDANVNETVALAKTFLAMNYTNSTIFFVFVAFVQFLDSYEENRELSLDLDNQWSYMKTHGDAGWEYSRRISMWLFRVLAF